MAPYGTKTVQLLKIKLLWVTEVGIQLHKTVQESSNL